MKKLLIYYLVILAPLILLVYCSNAKLISNGWFVALLAIYVFIYRNVTDYYRLRNKNVIGPNEYWQVLMPGFRIKYFKELYLI